MSKATAAGQPKLSGMKYLVEEVVSTDGRGSVLRVGDRADGGGTYALKVLHRAGPEDDPCLERCRASVAASAKLSHPSALRYYDYRDRKSWFRVVRGELLMEYVPGPSLDKLAGKLKAREWVLVFKHAAGALAHMHRRGVLHGDLTPARMLLSGSGAVKVIGYGQSLLKDGAQRTCDRHFAAPERARDGTLDERTDVYALGTSLYFLLTGKTPNALKNRGDDATVKVPRPSSLNKDVPAALDDLVLGCVQRSPANRPEGMFDVAKGLEELAGTLKLDDGMLRGAGKAAE